MWRLTLPPLPRLCRADWDTTTNPAAYITPLFAAIVISNFLGVRIYGEMEFWFRLIDQPWPSHDLDLGAERTRLTCSVPRSALSLDSAIKISAIVGLIILGIIINTGGVGGGCTSHPPPRPTESRL